MATATARTPSTIELNPRERGPEAHSATSGQSISEIDDVASASLSADSTAADSAVPDGGFGWTIVLGCAVQTFIFYGITSSWGIFQAALVGQDLAGSATLSFVGSVTVTCAAILALAGARVLRLLGSRATSILGILLLAIGQILSGFTTNNIRGLFVTAGFVTGIGNCLCFMVCSVLPNQYFSTKLGLAQGIIKAGGGLGGAALSLGPDAMILRLGASWAFRMLGLMTPAVGLPAAWIVKDRYPVRSASFIEWRLFRDFSFLMVFFAGAVATFAL